MSWEWPGGGPLVRRQMEQIHTATLEVLAETGLRVDCTDYHGPLESAGAKVDRASRVVKFPSKLVEETIDYFRKQVASGRRQHLLNGVTNPRWTPPLGCRFGGACVEYLDLDAEVVRAPAQQDLVHLLRLGQALDGVGFVGNPVACLVDDQGRQVPAPMQRIRTAALVAKHTTKCGSTEVWNEKELEFLLEIGRIVRGSEEAFQASPCFITAKETVAPLQFPADDGRVLLMLARRGLPCTIIPMPLTGGTSPCSVVANVVVGNAEVLGVLAAIHAAVPGALAGGGVISGIMDMAGASASFSAPEAILQDACFAQMYDVFYGQDFAIGTGYADAKYPGPQALAEKALKFQAAAWQGRFNFPVGLLAGGKRFSPEQAVMDLEIAETVRRMHAGVEVDSGSLAVEVIQRVGIGGEFLSDEHTVANFRRNLWIPPLSDRRCAGTLEADRRKDMLEAARQKVRDIWRRDDLYRIDDDRARAIDKVVAAAERILL